MIYEIYLGVDNKVKNTFDEKKMASTQSYKKAMACYELAKNQCEKLYNNPAHKENRIYCYMIRINRKNSYADKLRNYKVIIDGKCYGKIKNGEIKDIDITPGEHTMYLSIDWCISNKINFSVSENETVEFECGNSMKGWRSFFALFYVIFLSKNYLWVRSYNYNQI